MKYSSFLFLGLVIAVFVVLQGWFLKEMFLAPRAFTSTEAVISGEVTEVRAPIPGFLKSVTVEEEQPVLEDQVIFVITRLITDFETQSLHEEDVPIHALGSGKITDLDVKKGQYVQGNELLARIVDNSPDSLRVEADLFVPPKHVSKIRKHLPAEVRADYLFNGETVDAMITAVDPTYDAETQTLTVHLRLFRYPEGIDDLPIGLPATVTVYHERAADDNLISALYHRFFATSP